jgi:hypothetical protein
MIRSLKHGMMFELPNAEGKKKRCRLRAFLVERGGSLVEFASQSGQVGCADNLHDAPTSHKEV